MRDLIQRFEKAPHAVLILGVFILGIHLGFGGGAVFPIAGLTVLYLIARVGSWQYARHPRSVRAFLRLVQFSGWTTVILLGWLGASVPLISGTASYYVNHIWIFLTLFILVLGGTFAYLISHWERGRRLYERLADGSQHGSISSASFNDLFIGRSEQQPALAITASTAAVMGGMILSYFYSRSVVDAVFFTLLALILCPHLMGYLLARLWFQWKYLRRTDIVISDST